MGDSARLYCSQPTQRAGTDLRGPHHQAVPNGDSQYGQLPRRRSEYQVQADRRQDRPGGGPGMALSRSGQLLSRARRRLGKQYRDVQNTGWALDTLGAQGQNAGELQRETQDSVTGLEHSQSYFQEGAFRSI